MERYYECTLIRRQTIAQNTELLTFRPQGSGYQFTPGQYAYFTLQDPTLAPPENTRIFSFANPPQERELSIMLRLRPSPYKQRLGAMKPGDTTLVSRPIGFFSLHSDESKSAVCIAGGVGIAPFLSLLGAYISSNSPPITLFTVNQTYGTDPAQQFLANYQRTIPSLITQRFYTRERNVRPPDIAGRVTVPDIRTHVPNWRDAEYYLAGPTWMVEALADDLVNAGIPPQHVKMEAFTGYEPTTP